MIYVRIRVFIGKVIERMKVLCEINLVECSGGRGTHHRL